MSNLQVACNGHSVFLISLFGAWSCRVFLAISRMHVTCGFVRHGSRYCQHMLLSGHAEASFESEAQSEAPQQICHPNARCLNGLSRIRIHGVFCWQL